MPRWLSLATSSSQSLSLCYPHNPTHQKPFMPFFCPTWDSFVQHFDPAQVVCAAQILFTSGKESGGWHSVGHCWDNTWEHGGTRRLQLSGYILSENWRESQHRQATSTKLVTCGDMIFHQGWLLHAVLLLAWLLPWQSGQSTGATGGQCSGDGSQSYLWIHLKWGYMTDHHLYFTALEISRISMEMYSYPKCYKVWGEKKRLKYIMDVVKSRWILHSGI